VKNKPSAGAVPPRAGDSGSCGLPGADRPDAALGGIIPDSRLRALVAYIKTLKTG
jgi:hypothetical protein